MTTILVTGYGGFLGAEISRQLIVAGFKVRGIARSQYREMADLGVECIQGDVCDETLVRSVTKGCDAIINTAAKAGVWGSWQEYHRPNTLAPELLLDAAKRNGLTAFVQTSSPSVTFEGKPQSGIDESTPYPNKWLCNYPHTKALAEQLVLEAGKSGELATCALRPHLIWGNGDPHLFPRVISRTLAGRLRCVGDGKNLIDVVHVSNAARAHVQALQLLLDNDANLNGQALFLTDGEPIECWDWIRQILEAAEVEVPTRKISFPMAYRIGAVLEFVYRLMRRKDEPPMTRFVAAQLALDHYFSIDAAKRLIGYDPGIDRDKEMELCKPWLVGIASEMKQETGRKKS